MREGYRKGITLFNIRLFDDVLVLRGTESEAASILLKGKVILSCTDNVTCRGISLRLTATQRFKIVQDVQSPLGVKDQTTKEERELYHHNFGTIHTPEKHVLHAGNHEFDFEHILSGTAPESIEGHTAGHIVYQLKAVIDRGSFAPNAITRKHLRVVRTLPPSSLEFSQTMSVENVWANKCDYSISIPSKAVVYGSSIPFEINIMPLTKGLKIGQISCGVWEFIDFTPKFVNKHDERRVAHKEWKDHMDDEDIDGLYTIKRRIELPRMLVECLQDCEVADIKVRHKMKFVVQLINADGHTSELRATVPVLLFISPNLLVSDESNSVPELSSEIHAEGVLDNVFGSAAPPRYQEHQYDALYEGIDNSDFFSPAASGANTPRMLSRPPSSENLAVHGAGGDSRGSISGSSTPHRPSEAAVARMTGHRSPNGAHVHFGHDDLVERLQNAHISTQEPRSAFAGSGTNGSLSRGPSNARQSHHGESRSPPEYIDTENTGSATNHSGGPSHSSTPANMSSRSSGVNLTSIGEGQMLVASSSDSQVDLDALSRVPSYQTAMKVPIRNLSFESAPLYMASNSRSAPVTPGSSPPRDSPSSGHSSVSNSRSPSGSTTPAEGGRPHMSKSATLLSALGNKFHHHSHGHNNSHHQHH